MTTTLQEKQGYKKTELGWIPEDWKITKLGEILNVQTGNKNAQDSVENGLYPFFTRSVYTQRINSYSYNEEALFIAGEGNFSVKYYNGKFDLHQRTYMLTAINKAQVDMKFLQNAIQPRINRLVSTSVGSTVQSLRKPIIENLATIMPTFKEQQKIAEILSTVDEKIEKVEKQIEQAEQLKKALMQELLTKGIGHTEFKDTEIGCIPKKWDVENIGSIGRVVTGSTPKSSNKEYYMNAEKLWCSPSDMGNFKYIKDTKTKLSQEGFKQTRILPKTSILVTCIGSTIGKIGLAYYEMSTNQQINAIIANEKHSPDFIYYQILKIAPYIKSMAATQAVPILNKTDFSNIKIAIAPLEEQQKIAEILSSADEKIEILQNKKSEYEKLKKGLMQKLLTGQIRVRL